MNLDDKISTSGPLRSKILKIITEECCAPLTDCINNAIHDKVFPDELKLAYVHPIHKGKESFFKQNYRPISILPVLSKILERILYTRIISHGI